MINLIHGDCLIEMQNIPDGSVDLILTDPPYGTTACKWDSVIPLEPMWKQLKRIIKSNGAIVMTASQPFTTTLISSNMKMFKYCWVWDKDRSCGSLLAKKRPLKYHEDIAVFYGSLPTYNPQMTKGKMQHKASGGKSDNYGTIPIIRYISDEYYPRSIQTFKACHNMTGKVHPTQKPVALMEYLIKTYTHEGETVLDFTMGSGTTGVACKNLNRNFIGIEQDAKYFEIAKNRIETHSVQPELMAS
jgi:site-specific DNA-methyltransferase (adenine-specific)